MIAISLAMLFLFASAPAWCETLFYEPFNYPNGSLSKSHPLWNTTSGALTIDNGEAWTNSSVFRVITRETFQNVAVTFRLKNLGLTTSSGQSWHGVHMFLRYQSQYHLYAVTINRRDNRVVIKKKVPGGSSNGGTYYELGWGSFSVPYNAWQDVRALARNNSDGTVSLELYVNGKLLVGGKDTGQGGSPIRAAGYTGVRSDYTSLRFDDFRVNSLDAPAPAPAGDTIPPAISLTAPADGASVSGSVTISASASDEVGVAGVRFKIDGADLGAEDSAPPYEIAWDAAQAPDGPHTLTAVARDAAGNESSSSVVVSVDKASPAPAPDDPACLLSAGAWANGPLAAQAGRFTASFEAVPAAAGMDGVVGLSKGPASEYSALAAAVRFNSSGRIDARNGGEYAADSAISYTPLTTYYFRLEVNLPAKTYDAYVRPDASSEQALARKFAFRIEQAAVSSLDNIGLLASSGAETACAAVATAEGGGKGLTPREGEARALERFLSPTLADGINDFATFGPEADEVTVFDTRGRQIYRSSKGGVGGSLTWDARNPKGRIVRAGVYIVRIKTRSGETLYQSLAVVK